MPQELAPLGDEYNAGAADPPGRRRKRQWAACALAAVTVVLLSGAVVAAGSGSGPSADAVPPEAAFTPQPTTSPSTETPEAALTPQPTPPPATEAPEALLTLVEAAERYPDWYDESKGVWLHFEGSEGWFSDGQFFHRFIWQSTGDYTGVSTMSFQDVGDGYALSGSVTESGEYPMTLLHENGGCLLEMASGMGEGIIGSSVFYETPKLTVNRFVPVEESGVDGSGMEDVLGKTTVELLTGIGSFTVSDRASAPYGDGGLNTSFSAGMTALVLDPGGVGSLFYDDGSVTAIKWSIHEDYGCSVQISYELVSFIDGMEFTTTTMTTGQLTLTADGPRLWLYNPHANEETCFAPE
ncbi:MAG: hypothetical protein ACI4PC_07935 [Oscillospiraceae bacterium]